MALPYTEAAAALKFLVFYYFAGSGDEVSSARPEQVERDDIVQDLIPRLCDADDYVGILDSNETLMQLSYEPARGRYVLELPVLEERASWTCDLDLFELCACIEGLRATFTTAELPQLERKEWR